MAAVSDLDVLLIRPDKIILLDPDKQATLDILALISISSMPRYSEKIAKVVLLILVSLALTFLVGDQSDYANSWNSFFFTRCPYKSALMVGRYFDVYK